MSLFGFKDDSLLWFIILFILLFVCNNDHCDDDVGGMQENNRCLR